MVEASAGICTSRSPSTRPSAFASSNCASISATAVVAHALATGRKDRPTVYGASAAGKGIGPRAGLDGEREPAERVLGVLRQRGDQVVGVVLRRDDGRAAACVVFGERLGSTVLTEEGLVGYVGVRKS